MEHYKKFLIRLQTFNIRTITRKVKSETYPYEPKEVTFYDLSHENPSLNTAFKNEIKELNEHAITDLSNLTVAQATVHLRRLESLKELFYKFYNRYFGGSGPIPNSDENRRDFFYSLRLDEIFTVQDMPEDYSIIFPQHFLDDLHDSVNARRDYLEGFVRTVAELLNISAVEELPPAVSEIEPIDGGPNAAEEKTQTAPEVKAVGSIPVFKVDIIEELYDILKDYFKQEEQEPLKQLLQSGATEQSPLTFLENGNQLADAFRQLYDGRLIVGCNKNQLESWILNHFLYINKSKAQQYTSKYLNDYISTDTRTCKSPLLNVKVKADGQPVLVPLNRAKKSYNN